MKKDLSSFKFKTTWVHVALLMFSFIWVYPFLWMISASFKNNSEIFSGGLSLIPKDPTLDNYIRAWGQSNFSTYFLNSLIVTSVVVIIVLFSSAFAGYALGRYDFYGKKVLMALFLGSIAVPLVFTIIPIYELLNSMKLVGTLRGLILASAGGAHVIFLLLFSSYFSQIPRELDEAAEIDGCGFFKKFWFIMLPMAKPIIVTTIIMESMWCWNAFLLPLVLTLNNPSSRTLAVGLYAFRGENIVDWSGMAAGGVIAVIPIVIVFLCLQKYFVEGVAGAVKS